MGKFNPTNQLEPFRKLEKEGYISSFDFKRIHYGSAINFTFKLTEQSIDDVIPFFDYSKYKISIVYKTSTSPKVYVLEPDLVEKPKHVFPSDKSLCLYHKSEFQWTNTKSITTYLVPWVFLWVYYYEVWLITGQWLGEAYPHSIK